MSPTGRAARRGISLLRPGGTLVVCDGDFSKASLAIASGDPMHAVAQHFAENFVTDRFLIGKLRTMSRAAGFVTRDFRVQPPADRQSPDGHLGQTER